MEESQALCTKPKEVEALCKESAGAKRANATEEAKGTKEGKGAKEAKDVSSYSPHELGKREKRLPRAFFSVANTRSSIATGNVSLARRILLRFKTIRSASSK